MALPGMVLALVFHEYAHALTATWLGDPTPRLSGRLSLSPQAHLDPLGTILFLVAGFGWAKPVPIAPWRMRWRRWGEVATAAAGPAANLTLAFVLAVLEIWLIRRGFGGPVQQIIGEGFLLNLSFGLFNLLPVPPLDGSAILGGFLSSRQGTILAGLNNYGGLLLLVLVLSGFFWRIFGPVLSTVAVAWQSGAGTMFALFWGRGPG